MSPNESNFVSMLREIENLFMKEAHEKTALLQTIIDLKRRIEELEAVISEKETPKSKGWTRFFG